MTKTFEGKSRLVCLAYQVLNNIDVVVSGKTDGELMAVLVAAFHQHAVGVAGRVEPADRPTLRAGVSSGIDLSPPPEWRHDDGRLAPAGALDRLRLRGLVVG
jgi:hypothetical protein